MTKYLTRPSRLAAIVAVTSLMVEPMAPLVWAAGAGQAATKPAAPQTQPATKPATPQTQPAPKPATPAAKPAASAAAAPATPPPVDGGWPRIYELKGGGNYLVYQPQVASWDQQKTMVAFSAVSYRPKANDKPLIGTIKLEAQTKVSTAERLVSFENMKILEANFQGLEKDKLREIVSDIDAAIPHDTRVIALERV